MLSQYIVVFVWPRKGFSSAVDEIVGSALVGFILSQKFHPAHHAGWF